MREGTVQYKQVTKAKRLLQYSYVFGRSGQHLLYPTHQVYLYQYVTVQYTLHHTICSVTV